MLTVSLLVCAMMALTRANGDEDTSINGTVNAEGVTNITFSARAGCSGDWKLYNGRCFFHDTTKRSWAQAELNCQSIGGNLASVLTADEYTYVQQMTTDLTWLGGSACQEEGSWFWSDAKSMKYTYWCAGQPDNTKDQCCLQMNTGDGKCWDDVNCSSLHGSICVKTP